MLRILAASLAFLTATPSFAITRAMFYAGDSKAVITLQSPALGGKEKDAQNLFDVMKIAPDTTPDQISKTVASADRDLAITCAHRIRTSYTCTLTVLASPLSAIHSQNGSVDYVAHDSQAAQLSALFNADFSTLDQMVRIESRPGEFRMSFQQR